VKVVVTGAGGFIGRRLLARLLRGRIDEGELTSLTAVDIALPELPPHVRAVRGSIADPSIRVAAFQGDVDVLFHLAAIPGGAAEADQELGWMLNQWASFALLERSLVA
jgi:nucleoside-diphosphate-sugar epimerase